MASDDENEESYAGKLEGNEINLNFCCFFKCRYGQSYSLL